MNAQNPLVKFRMRMAFVLIALLACIPSLRAQSVPESQVPQKAVASFKQGQPGIPATWMAGPSGSFEAMFSKGGQDQIFVYDPAGTLQYKKLKAPLAQMPASVKGSLDANAQVEAAYKVISRTQEKFYEVQVASQGGSDRLRFDLEGKPTGRTTLIAQAKPAPSPTIAAATKPEPAVAKPQPSVAMRGESATASSSKPGLIEEEMEEELEEDLYEEEEEEWEEVDEEELEEDLYEEEEEEDLEDWEEVEDDGDEVDPN